MLHVLKLGVAAFIAISLWFSPLNAQDSHRSDSADAQNVIKYCVLRSATTDTSELGCVGHVTKHCMTKKGENPRVFELLSCIEVEEEAWLFYLTAWEDEYAQGLAVIDRLNPLAEDHVLDSYLTTKNAWSQYKTAQCDHERLARDIRSEGSYTNPDDLISNKTCSRNLTALRALELYRMMQ
jgi:hypothetical protein